VLDHVARELELREGLREEERLLRRLGRLKLPVKIPLYPFQKRGVLFAAMRERTILADDMGLGKTAQAIGAACLLAERRGLRGALVVCPASVKYQWEREVRRFCDRSAVVIEGGRGERARLYDSDVFFKIVNYEAVVRDKHLLAERDFDLVVLDEAQRIKNWKTKTARSACASATPSCSRALPWRTASRSCSPSSSSSTTGCSGRCGSSSSAT
jgi:SNF2 family DNA or RNA helicase